MTINGAKFSARVGGKTYRRSVVEIQEISREPGLAWASVRIDLGSTSISVDGIPNDSAYAMVRTIEEALIADLAKAIAATSAPIKAWAKNLRKALPTGRWITREDFDRTLESLPQENAINASLRDLLSHPKAEQAIDQLPESLQTTIRLDSASFSKEVESLNAAFLETELKACKVFFDRVERQPLTEEQARAVVCFENKLLLVAAAGSGKTSTLVAKAGYAVHRGLAKPGEILMLAFNADAAKELQSRIQARLGAISTEFGEIRAQTFHAFGLGVIGQATGKKPDLAPWLENNNGVDEMASIIDHLRQTDIAFRAKWALYKVVFSDDLPKFGTRDEPEDRNPESGERGFLTRNGEIVKSKEERTIADWLFFNGVRYIYEGRYEVETADEKHRQYRPDFYYPDARLYHEHFALDEEGRPPKHFDGYLESVIWKRAAHATNKTDFFETTSAGLRTAVALNELAKELVERGVELDPQENREAPGRPVPNERDLARSFRVFQSHAKSNRLSIEELRRRLIDRQIPGLAGRHALYLDLYEHMAAEWDRRLRVENCIDFEDMLNEAADHIDSGEWKSPYRLVLADEFQDASRARARLLHGLANGPNRYLCAVGDDWQGINGFAGADIGVMARFEEIFGRGARMFLSTTFRCPQALCDVGGTFITRNPVQISKTVRSTNIRSSPPLVCYSVPEDTRPDSLVYEHLKRLWHQIQGEKVAGGSDGAVSVFILGRYWKDRPSEVEAWNADFAPNLRVEYKTLHGSKGLEADYVFIVGLTRGKRGRLGFPSEIEDDAVHQLAMPEQDPFRFAEERRLFYVGLTRAKRLVLLYTAENRASEFVVELSEEPFRVPVRRAQGSADVKACPSCKRGFLVRRPGRNGLFWGCTRYPACDHTMNIQSGQQSKDQANRRKRDQGKRNSA